MTNIPFITVDIPQYNTEITGLNEASINVLNKICNKYLRQNCTDTVLSQIQADIDSHSGGKRIFEVRRVYREVRSNARVYDREGKLTDYIVVNKELCPYELEIIYVGDDDG